MFFAHSLYSREQRATSPWYRFPSRTVMFINDFVSPLTRSWNHSPLPQTYFSADRMLHNRVRVAGAEILFHSFFSLRVISVHWTGYRPQPQYLPLRLSSQPHRPRLKKSFANISIMRGLLLRCQNIQHLTLNKGRRKWNQRQKGIC
jgi:hypothetical protein